MLIFQSFRCVKEKLKIKPSMFRRLFVWKWKLFFLSVETVLYCKNSQNDFLFTKWQQLLKILVVHYVITIKNKYFLILWKCPTYGIDRLTLSFNRLVKHEHRHLNKQEKIVWRLQTCHSTFLHNSFNSNALKIFMSASAYTDMFSNHIWQNYCFLPSMVFWA